MNIGLLNAPRGEYDNKFNLPLLLIEALSHENISVHSRSFLFVPHIWIYTWSFFYEFMSYCLTCTCLMI